MKEARLRALLRSEKWWRFVAAVKSEMLYGPEITQSKHLLQLDVLSGGDLIQVAGEWHTIKRVILPTTVVLMDGRPVSKNDMPETVVYRHKDDGALVTATLLFALGGVAFAATGVVITLGGILVALVTQAPVAAAILAASVGWVVFVRRSH